MNWVTAVTASVGVGVLAGWIYAGFPSFRRLRVTERTGEQSSETPVARKRDPFAIATRRLPTGDPLLVIEKRSP